MYTGQTGKLIKILKNSDLKAFYAAEESARVQVDMFVSRVASIYEKIRNAIEYKEDNLLRKSAIFRILQRLLLIKISTEPVANTLIKELIRAGYLENNVIPLKKVDEVQRIIEKYLAVFNLSSLKRTTKVGNQMFSWLLGLAACEIEECLVPPVGDRALVEFMYQIMRPRIDIADRSLGEKEKDLLIYLGAYRALARSDEPMADFLLLKYYSPGWTKADQPQVLAVAKKIINLKSAIERQKKHYAAPKLKRLFKKYTFVFNVLRDIIVNDPAQAEQILSDPDLLEEHVRKNCNASYKSNRIKLRRSILRVTIYLFLTKMLLALVLEIPYDRYFADGIQVIPLVINALFPPVLIFVLGMFIRVPSKKNTNTVVALAREAVYKNSLSEVKGNLDVNIKRSNVFNFIFNLLYSVLFGFSFGVLIWLLNKIGFNPFSIFIFLLFLSMVSFFGIKMRLKIRELVVVDSKENPVVFLFNLFSLPFLKAGHWISENFSKINVFVFVLDFIIEAPFKIFLEVIEDWLAFLKEKKEEIYSKE